MSKSPDVRDGRRKLSRALRQLRADAQLTQQELANHLNKPQSYVSKYESGERQLDIVELKLICDATGITLGDFVSRLEDILS